MNVRGREIPYDGKIYTSYKEIADVADVPYWKMTEIIRKKGVSAEDAVLEIKIAEDEAEKPKKDSTVVENKSVIDEESKVAEVEPIITKPKEVSSEICTPSVWQRPNYMEIKTPAEAVSVIGTLDISNINLIDYENVYNDEKLLRKYINNKDTLNVFFYNATKYSNQFFTLIKGCKNDNFQVHIFECGKQVVDHLISYYLGAIYTAFPDMGFTIISKDTGFYGFIASLCNPKIHGVIKYIESGEDRYKYSLCKYIANNNILNNRHTVSCRELEMIFKNFYDAKGTEYEVDDLVDTMVKFGIGTVLTKGDFKWFDFNMAKIHAFVDEYKW